jgi:hypothetical protein
VTDKRTPGGDPVSARNRSPDMILVQITDEEAQVLLDDLETQVSELGMEIANTDVMKFRDQIKRRRAALQRVAEKLRQARIGATEPSV